MNQNKDTLFIPEKPDPERDAVASAWESEYGDVIRLGRFWDPPLIETDKVAVYGHFTFCLVLKEKLNLHLATPPDDLILQTPQKFLGRDIKKTVLKNLTATDFPVFVKPFIPKLFQARVYQNLVALRTECTGLDDDCEVILSEPVSFITEARAFILDGKVLDCALYEGEGSIENARKFVKSVIEEMEIPITVVIDMGLSEDGKWSVIEYNATWGSGLNGCDAKKVLPAIAAAMEK